MDNENEAVLDELLDRWEEARENGNPMSVDDLCRNHPELKEEVEKQIHALQSIEGVFSPKSVMHSGVTDSVANESEYDPCRLVGKTVQSQSELEVSSFYRQGGSGAIYFAQQKSLGRVVALKSMLPVAGGLSSESPKMAEQKFRTEAEITSRLEHPGILPIYQTGVGKDESPFYTMRFVQDSCLDDIVSEFHSAELLPNESEERFLSILQNFSAVCKTIAYAHSRGIVHRDIKPQNILVGKYGETLVIDWGLARPFKRTGQFKTVSEETLDLGHRSEEVKSDKDGTIAYMSPQQHQGRIPAPSDDIYSLGATLYKILCGKSPVHHLSDEAVAKVRQQVIKGEIPRPFQVKKEVSPEVQAICLKAMETRSANRYETALEISKDVDRFIAGQPISCYKESPIKSATRWVNQHLLTTQLLGSSLVLASIALMAISFFLFQFSSAHNNARKKNLVALASSYARTVGNDLDTRIRILEKESSSPKLIQIVSQWNDEQKSKSLPDAKSNPTDTAKRKQRFGQLAKWANEVVRRYDGRSKQNVAFRAVCVYDLKGIMIARCGSRHDLPNGEKNLENHNAIDGSGTKVLGKDFSFRDYFHGQGADLPSRSSEHKPIHNMPYYISSVYRSQSNGDFHFQITVPIKSLENQQTIGLLGMAMQIGQMNFPKNGIVVSTRTDNPSTKNPLEIRQHGLLIHTKDQSTGATNLPEDSLNDLQKILQRQPDTFGAQLLPSSFYESALSLPRNAILAAKRITIPHRNRSPESVDPVGWVLLAIEEDDHNSP